MKYTGLILFSFVICLAAKAQPAIDYKTKTAANAAERTAILDAFRATLQKQWKQQFEFVVNYLKVAGNYAWFQGDVQRKDGKVITFPDDGEYDCCHGEALLEKKNGKWTVLTGDAFSTDVWYDGINKTYPQVPRAVFPKDAGWVR